MIEWPETEHLRAERRGDGVAVITIDCPGHSQNTLDRQAIDDAARLLDAIEADHGLHGVVFVSGKPGSFVAGADVEMIAGCATADEATRLSRTGQRLFARISGLRVPVIAAIDGTCLGGGLELALACDYRLATDAGHTRLGLPEVQLGLVPGTGGTQRLPRLIGLPAALDLMLTGRELSARKARGLGMVDEIVPSSILLDAALAAVEAGAERPRRGALQRLARWASSGNPAGRALVAGQARRTTKSKTHGNYPAPPRIIECAERGLAAGLERGLELEAKAFGELAKTPECEELIRIYFATTEMKKDRGVDDPEVEPREVRRAAVLGAGLMGAGIALVTADRAGTPVRLKDVAPEGLVRGLDQIARGVSARVHRGSLTRFQGELARRRVTPTLDYSGFGRADVVFEAVFEDVALKQRMLGEVAAHGPEGVIFATNTSSIPIAEIADGAPRPDHVIGMHYFSPVERMPLVEIIPHTGAAPEVVATAVALSRRQGKTPIVVGDAAGFYVNRILAPYLNEAAHLLAEGVAIDRIDGALVRFGFPLGPFKLLDEVGIDISAHVGPILHRAFGERMRPSPVTDKLVEDGRLGRKAGRGFYRYAGRRPGTRVDEAVYELLEVSPGTEMDEATIIDRTVLPMVSEAVRCLDDGVLRGARDGDIGAVFGIGFPPFRGGPLRYLEHRGVATVAERLAGFRETLGERFETAPGLIEGRRFHP